MKWRFPVSRARVHLNRTRIEPETLNSLKAALTFRLPVAYLSRGLADAGAPVFAYEEDGDDLWVPRYTPWASFGLQTPIPLRPSTRPVEARFRGTLRDYQQEPYRLLCDRLRSQNDGILSLACGKGKTTLALAGWCALGRPGLAIVPTLQIAAQWIERLQQFTDIPTDAIGQIGGGSNDWEGKAFVVSTIQTLSQKRFPDAFYRQFGVVFYDEVHRLGAPLFSTTGGLFDGTRIGLSATWKRADGLEKLFLLHIGPVFYEDHEQELTPRVHFVLTPAMLNLNQYRMWGRQGKINFARIITDLSRDEGRRALVMGIVHADVREGRKILVLGDRKEELVYYDEELREQQVSCGVCVGSLDGRVMTQDVRTSALQTQVVLATSQLVKEGLDQPDFDTLVILYPKSGAAFAEQAAGRILRTHAGKQAPKIYVLQDHGCTLFENGETKHPFSGQCALMARTFRSLDYAIA